MKKALLFLSVFTILNLTTSQAAINKEYPIHNFSADSSRVEELDKFWEKMAQSVKEGNLEDYSSFYHPDAVVIFGEKTSVSIKDALKNWEQGFIDTHNGKSQSDVHFRFSQRIGNESTAYEKGMFHYTFQNSESGKNQDIYVNFEALLVKKDGKWQCLMENQKSVVDKEEWAALK